MTCIKVSLLVLLASSTAMAFVPILPMTGRTQTCTLKASVLEAPQPLKAPLTTSETIGSASEPILDISMQKLKLPRFAVGTGPITMPVKIQDQGPFRFMVDTGLTKEIVSPQLMEMIQNSSHQKKKKKSIFQMQGLAAGGKAAKQDVIELSDVALVDETHPDVKVSPNLEAMVGDFVQVSLDPQKPVAGMIGMDVLLNYDVDIDYPAGRIRLWSPGTAAKEAKRLGMVEIPTSVINESLLLGTRITGKLASDKQKQEEYKQPFLGIIDSGSTFSAINWEAAKLMGLPPKSNVMKYNPLTSPPIMASGMDNKPLYLPTKKIQFTFCGDVIENKDHKIIGFESPPETWTPWKPVMAAIGDLPIFELLLGTETNPYKGPAGIIGMDILSQRRVILEAAPPNWNKGKKIQLSRRMFVSPK